MRQLRLGRSVGRIVYRWGYPAQQPPNARKEVTMSSSRRPSEAFASREQTKRQLDAVWVKIRQLSETPVAEIPMLDEEVEQNLDYWIAERDRLIAILRPDQNSN